MDYDWHDGEKKVKMTTIEGNKFKQSGVHPLIVSMQNGASHERYPCLVTSV